IKVVYGPAPFVTAPVAHLELECDQGAVYSTLITDWPALSPSATLFRSTVSVSNDFDVNDLSVACGSELTVTFSATDACENTGTATAKIKVVDATAAVITAPVADLELECDQGADYSTLINDWLANASAAD